MQTPAQIEGVRRRLREAIEIARGEVTTRVVREVSVEAGVNYTTLARYLLWPEAKRTTALRQSTLNAVALAVDADPGWVKEGQGQMQLSHWPLLHKESAESELPDPHGEVLSLLQQLRESDLPDAVRVRAYRAAVSAIIEEVAAEGRTVGHTAYRSLMRLDSLRRSNANVAAG